MAERHRRRGGGGGGARNRNSRSANRTDKSTPSFRNPAIQAIFEAYRTQLDLKHDRHERLVKLSRDVTIESKRIIFLLHRISVRCSAEERSQILTEADERLTTLRADKLKLIGEEMEDEDHDLYCKAFSPGLQEYMEALSFYHYLRENEIISHPKSREVTTVENSAVCPLSSQDYVLGLADLSGELMRMAMNAAAAGDLEEPPRILAVLRGMAASFRALQAFGLGRDFGQKVNTLDQSLKKVERLCYTQHLRGEEALPPHLMAALEASDEPE